jgi:hypothetical protein
MPSNLYALQSVFMWLIYCKRPIQCLASSKILTPHPVTARRMCTLPPLVRGEDTLAGWRGGGEVNSLEDARHCSVLCKYFVTFTIKQQLESSEARCWAAPAIEGGTNHPLFSRETGQDAGPRQPSSIRPLWWCPAEDKPAQPWQP